MRGRELVRYATRAPATVLTRHARAVLAPLAVKGKSFPMPVMQPPTGPIEITDPNNVPDVLINGPFNVMNTGGMVHITFTNVRPDDGDLFSGKNPPRLRGAVACRLLMPAGVANQLVRTLADVLIQAAQSSEPASNQAQPNLRPPTKRAKIAVAQAP